MFQKPIFLAFAAVLLFGPAGCSKSNDDLPKAVSAPDGKGPKPRGHGRLNAGAATPTENDGDNK